MPVTALGTDGNLTLRAFREEDLGFLDRLCTDPAALGCFEWFGFRDARSRRRRWEQDGVDYLFRFTTVHRLEAGTDADNLAEQKALEHIGFTGRASSARWPSAPAAGATA